ncbi:MAG TPA: MFS transporter [Chthonomonadaceae bacterium]|nr:MFS transporter [Chthonomonadaceae bacterium]
MRRYRTGLGNHPDFLKLWLGRTVSHFGSHITSLALALTAVLWLKATPVQMGLLAATGNAAILLFGLLAGVWVDRLRRRQILIATDLGRAVALASIPVAAMGGWLSLAQLYLVGALTGVQSVFFDVADRSYLPTLVSREQLLEANAKLHASEAVAEVSGQALAGILVQWLSAPIAILLDSLSYVFSALCLGLIRTPEPPPIASEERERAWREGITGLRVVLRNPFLRALAASESFREFFGGSGTPSTFCFWCAGWGFPRPLSASVSPWEGWVR